MPLLMLDAYSAVGFRLNNGMRVFGPVAVFPTCVLSWLVPRGAAGITRESLSLFTLVHPKPEIVYVGVGNADEVGGHSFYVLTRGGERHHKCAGVKIAHLRNNHFSVQI